MKPRYTRFAITAFPALIVVPALLQIASAGSSIHFINPDTAGNVVVNGNYDELNGSDWTVLASGGTTSPFSVEIKAGATLTGEASNANGVEVTTVGYTIDNSGSLDVKGNGILSRVGNTTVQNNAGALIQGGNSGIQFNSSEIVIGVNSPTIVDVVPGNTVSNDGTIIGSEMGILSNSNFSLSVNNNSDGTISGNFGPGIAAYGSLTVTNDGSITGGSENGIGDTILKFGNGSGIFAESDAEIMNYGTITGLAGDGVTAYGGLVLENTGTISGQGDGRLQMKELIFAIRGGGSGIATGSDATIINHFDGNITGRNYGISAGNNLNLTNYGTISGTGTEAGYAGVIAADQANITNYGTISGDQVGISLVGEGLILNPSIASVPSLDIPAVVPSTITNSGTISGSEAAIQLGSTQNIVNLDFGSNVIGDIRGNEGVDTINFLNGSETPAQQQNIVRGSVYGVETITKSGSGYAFIGAPGSSVEVFANNIDISGGGLIINGSLSSQSEGKASVTLSGDGRLDGTGNWNADITLGSGGLSAGSTSSALDGGDTPILVKSARFVPEIISADSAVGSLTINGNVGTLLPVVEPPVFTLSAKAAAPQPSSYLRVDIRPQVEIANGVSHDIIYHTGSGNTFDLTGLDIQLAPTDINKTLTEGKYTIVDSENPLVGVDQIGNVGVHFGSGATDSGPFQATGSGENNTNTVLTRYFTTVGTEDPQEQIPGAPPSTFAAAAFDPNNTNLVVNIQHAFADLPGLTSNQAALAGVIDGLVNNPSPILQDFIAALDFSDLAGVQSTLATLDPSATLGLANSVVNSNYRLHRLTQEHLASIRGNGREYTDTAPSSKDAKGVITPGASTVHSTGRGNAWGSFSYDGQDNEGAANNGDFDGTSGAFTAGVDWLVAPQLVAGIVLDGSKGSYDSDNYSTDIDSFRGAAYATYGGATGFYSDALVGFGTHSLDSSLGSNGVLIGSTSNDTDADSFQAMWTAGYTFGDAALKHGPFGGFEYQKVGVDGYTQGGPLAIKVGSYDVESLRALIGYRVNAQFGKFRPYASAAYAHEFEDGANHTTASLAGVPFRVSGAEQSSAFILTAGTGYTLTESLTLDVGYRGDIATDDGITSHGGSIGINYSF